jgi:ribosomal protein L39E
MKSRLSKATSGEIMSKIKTSRVKATLGKMLKRNRRLPLFVIAKTNRKGRLPLFVIAKTNRKVTRNTETRNWRNQKLKMRSQKRKRLN